MACCCVALFLRVRVSVYDVRFEAGTASLKPGIGKQYGHFFYTSSSFTQVPKK
jgi:hypothetical protein